MHAIIAAVVTAAALLAVVGVAWLIYRHFTHSNALRRAERRPRDITSDALLPVLTGEGAGQETVVMRVQRSPRRGLVIVEESRLTAADIYDGESATEQAAAEQYARLRGDGCPPHAALPASRRAASR